MAVAAERLDEATFAKFFACGIKGFGDAIGIKEERVAGREQALRKGAIPILEDAQDCGSSGEAFEGIIGAKKKGREMAAVYVAETPRGSVVLGEEESGEGGVGGIVAEELVHRSQKAMRLVEGDGALATQIGLEIGHEKSGGNAFAGNVGNHEAEAFVPRCRKS